jgi:hypothetical protein
VTKPTDDALVAETKALRERLLYAERELLHLRAELGEAIRELHGRGWSHTEIAAALGLSRQRVHQIVGEEEPEPEDGRPRGRAILNLFDPEAREAIAVSQAEARALGHATVEAEHLLLALSTRDTATGEELRAAGVDAAVLRTAVARRYPAGPVGTRGWMRIGRSARATVDLALDAADARGETPGERHLAAALAAPGNPAALLVPS